MVADKLASMELTAEQMEVAKALIEGYKKEIGPIMRGRDVLYAGCYAKRVDMPEHLRRVHKLYLADYVTIDVNFYPWFESNGVDKHTAWDVSKRVQEGYDACSAGTTLKKKFSKG